MAQPIVPNYFPAQYGYVQAQSIPTHYNSVPAPVHYYSVPTMMRHPASHAPMLPQAFQTMTPQDPSWNMDTGASSHLTDNTGKHVKLPFYTSESSVKSVFEIIHSDIWTSPIPGESVIKYYAIFLDHFSHFVWVYPLHKKSDLCDNFVAFRAYVNKQFNVDIKAFQCDHRGVKRPFLDS
ncbi:ribonuclease H-like domain-containing protein [Tanacetum coccineum]